MLVVVFKSSFLGLCLVFWLKDGEDGGSFFTIILGLPRLLDANGDFFPPGGVLSIEDIVIASDPPF